MVFYHGPDGEDGEPIWIVRDDGPGSAPVWIKGEPRWHLWFHIFWWFILCPILAVVMCYAIYTS